jgi:HEAT repeat protein
VTTPPQPDVPRESTRTILFQFVLFPLGVVVVGVAIFLLFGMLASEEHSNREYLQDISQGSRQRRWQAAYQLSQSIDRGEAQSDPQLAGEVARLYQGAKDDDPQVRRYLASVLGKLEHRPAVPLLIEGLEDDDPETRIYTLMALGQIGDSRALEPVTAYAKHEDAGLRKTAVYVLGELGDQRAKPVLTAALADEAADVRWNAAIALSRFDDPAAVPVLREMLDRGNLEGVSGMTEAQKEEAMIVAMAPYLRLAGDAARPVLQSIAKADPNLRVQAAAREALSGG